VSGEFSFDPEKHEYRVAGRAVPACTHVLAAGGLVSFNFVNEELLERKSELGTQVHKACHLFNSGKKFTCDEQIEGYLNSWETFYSRTKLAIRLSEHRQIASVNGMEYGMQIDVEGVIRGEDVIIDIKTGQVYAHHGIQLAGYAAGLYHPQLETPMGRFRTRKRIVVQLKEDGSLAKIHRFEDKSDFDVFTSALYVTHWKMRHEKEYREKP
jgi:hypothetical protein